MYTKKLCMFCMKAHRKIKPLICRQKAALASALFEILAPAQAMYICDRTGFLNSAIIKLKKAQTVK